VNNDLVERVARAIAGDDDDWWEDYSLYAKRAIAVALKEAAKIAENKAEVLSQYRDTYAAVQAATAQDIADAILNLKGEE
jgi:hypothetical protein